MYPGGGKARTEYGVGFFPRAPLPLGPGLKACALPMARADQKHVKFSAPVTLDFRAVFWLQSVYSWCCCASIELLG
jgi:hypothetical protein